MKKKNKKNEITYKKTTALIFDRLYGEKPNAVAVIIGRIAIAAAIAFFGMGYVFSMYNLPPSNVPFSLIAAGFAVVFSLIFVFVRKRIAIPVLMIAGGVLILWRFRPFWEKFSYFIDSMVLQCDGRFFDAVNFTVHPPEMIEFNGAPTKAYADGVVFGCVILCALFALITAAGLIGKPHIIPSLALFLLLWCPRLLAEKLYFDWRLIIITALYAGVIVIGSYYRDGLAIRHVYAVGGYRRKLKKENKRFDASVKLQSFGQRANSRGLHYSKYFSSAMSAAAIFVVIGIVLNIVFRDNDGINYDSFYEMLQGINFGSSKDVSPFKNGPESDYFASPFNSVFKQNNRLKLTSPSRSTKEILRVSKNSYMPVYLRGDIGIDFDGVSWSSPVTEEPTDWKYGDISDYWLPIEMSAMKNIYQNYTDGNWYYDFNEIGVETSVDVEYLCDTDVVFVPAYDEQYGVFASDDYTLFGDFAARRKTDSSKNEKLSYLAVVPNYIDASESDDLDYFRTVLESYSYVNEQINVSSFCDRVLSSKNIQVGKTGGGNYESYIDFVNSHYLGVPENLKSQLDEYTEKSGLLKFKETEMTKCFDILGNDYGSKSRTLAERFGSAMILSNFLKTNYNYSLNARIDSRNPVMSFLNDTKSGHCALYASAMTLILREWGIPARYCTGFAVNANSSSQTLRSKDLHAWCEVYLDELGWVTFDPTASAVMNPNGGTTGNSQISSQTVSSSPLSLPNTSSNTAQSGEISVPQSSETHLSVPDNSNTPAVRDSSVSTAESGGMTFAQMLPYLLMILLICAAVAIVVLVIITYRNLKKRAYKQIQSFRRECNSDYIYAKLLAVLKICKLEPQRGEQPHEFFERVENSLDCAICDNYILLEKLVFGNSELEDTEQAALCRIFEKVYRAAENKLKLVGKIKLRLLLIKK